MTYHTIEYYAITWKDTKMMYSKCPIYEPSSCKLSRIGCVFTCPIMWCNFSSGCNFLYYCVEYSNKSKPRIFGSRQFPLPEKALLAFETWDSKIGLYMKLAAAIKDVIQCYCVIYNKEKRATIQTALDHFFNRLHKLNT